MSFSPEAGDYLTWQQTRPGLMPELHTAYVERVTTLDGEPRPKYWPGFQLVLRSPAGQVSTVPLPRGARPATDGEVQEYREAQEACSPALPLDVQPTRTYTAPDGPLILF